MTTVYQAGRAGETRKALRIPRIGFGMPAIAPQGMNMPITHFKP
jgi:hypothetical protein